MSSGQRRIHDPHDPVLEHWYIEVQEQPHGALPQFEIGQHLCAVDRRQGFDSLDFYDDAILDEHVDAVANVKPQSVVDDRRRVVIRPEAFGLAAPCSDTLHRLIRAGRVRTRDGREWRRR